MADVRLIAIGQKMPDWVQTACTEYLARFRRQFKLILEEIPASKISKMNTFRALRYE